MNHMNYTISYGKTNPTQESNETMSATHGEKVKQQSKNRDENYEAQGRTQGIEEENETEKLIKDMTNTVLTENRGSQGHLEGRMRTAM